MRSRIHSPYAQYRKQPALKTTSPDIKSTVQALLLQIPGVEAGDMSGLPAFFVKGKMFACIHGGGVAIRLPAAAATELQFSNANVTPFQPNGRPSTREWIQINHDDLGEYAKDFELFRSSVDFVKGAK